MKVLYLEKTELIDLEKDFGELIIQESIPIVEGNIFICKFEKLNFVSYGKTIEKALNNYAEFLSGKTITIDGIRKDLQLVVYTAIFDYNKE